MKLNRSLKIILCLLAYKLIFDFSIYVFIQEEYGYIGGIIDFNMLKYILSYIYLLIIFMVMPKTNYKPSHIFLQIHLLIMIIPILSLYGMQNKPGTFTGMIVFMFILQSFIIRNSKKLRLVKIKHSRTILLFIIVGISIFVYFSMLRANGLPSLSTFNFWNVYKVRWNVRYPFLMNYLVQWQAKVINPLLITLSYLNKKRKLLWISISLQVLIYLITSHKSFILIPLAIIIVVLVLDKYDFFKTASYMAGLGVAGSLIVYKMTEFVMVPFIIIYRLLYLPAQIKYYYYDFFSTHKLIYFSEGVIGKISGLSFPYEMPTVNMISGIYFGMPQSAANTGYLADAYANGGFVGMFFMTMLLTFVFIVLDSLTLHVRKDVVVGLSIFSVIGLNDLGLLTSLLTGGMLFLMLVLYLENESKLINSKK